ncbi:MAG: hypothetical protein RLZZ608_153 [Actinomycetota bacterium]|jgi:hypothetical protein
MTRAMLIGGGAVAALLGFGALAFAILLATSATPAAHVQRYLDALARDDHVAAAQLAGLEPPTAMPVGDEGEPSIHRVIASSEARDGSVDVIAEYGDDTDAVRVTFTLRPAPPIFGLVPAWAFATPPVTTLEVSADRHDVIAVNGQSVVANAAGESVAVSVFVPARVSVHLDEPLLAATAQTVRVGAAGGVTDVALTVEPTDRLQRTVQREVERLLSECAEQSVLQPTGCPFGITIVDRVVEPPAWRLDDLETVSIEPGGRAGVWSLRSEGSVQLVVDVQRLFDGTITSRDELMGFIVRGELTIVDRRPEIRLFAAGG